MTFMRTALAALLGLSVVLSDAVNAGGPDRELETLRKHRAEIEASMKRTRDELARLASFVPDWNVGGADPDADLKAMGADRYYFASRGSFGVGVTILTDRPIEFFTPKTWRLLDSYGAPATGAGEPWMNFVHLFDGRFVLASTGRSVKNGDAFCGSDGGEQRLFEIPGVKGRRGEPGTELAREIVASVVRTMAEDEIHCSRYDGDRVRGYTSRDFLTDGREFAPSNNPAHWIIVPACPIDRILKPPVKITRKQLRTPGFVLPPWTKAPRPRSC